MAAMAGVILVAFGTGCRQDTTLTLQSTEVIKDTVSFKADLQPIFTAKCAIAGCHSDGGQTPDLESGKAYQSLISMSLVDTTVPKTSIIFERLTGVLSPAMPLTGSSDPDNINALVLAWITQGAKNN